MVASPVTVFHAKSDAAFMLASDVALRHHAASSYVAGRCAPMPPSTDTTYSEVMDKARRVPATHPWRNL
jgi:hypothetical protein